MTTPVAVTVLRLYAARTREIMDLVVADDPRVHCADDGEGDAAEPTGAPCDKASANDARSGGGDGVRARAAALTEDLAENFEGRKAMQVTYYEPEPQFRAASSLQRLDGPSTDDSHLALSARRSGMGQHFDSRGRYLSIATMSLRASVKLVQIRHGPKDCMQRSELQLLPRSIYLMSGPARANCQAQRNHEDCHCCWMHGIETDLTEPQGRIGVTLRQLAQLALDEAKVKRDADERAARDAYAYAPLTRKRAVHDEEAPAPAPAPVPKKRRQKPAAAEQPEVVEEEAPAAELRVGGGAVDKETGQAFRVVGKTKGWWTV